MVYYIARDFIDISHCINGTSCLVLLSRDVLLGRFITARVHTAKQRRGTHNPCETDFPERQSDTVRGLTGDMQQLLSPVSVHYCPASQALCML